MSHWREIPSEDEPVVVRPRAVAYYRHSAEDPQRTRFPFSANKFANGPRRTASRLSKSSRTPGNRDSMPSPDIIGAKGKRILAPSRRHTAPTPPRLRSRHSLAARFLEDFSPEALIPTSRLR